MSRLSHRAILYPFYTHVRAKTTGVSVYLFFISAAIREDLEDKERWSQSLRRVPCVSSAEAMLRPTEYLITAFTVEREENNAPDQRRMAPLGNALLCVYLVLLIASVGASLPLRWNGDRVSLCVDVPCMYIRACMCVFAHSIYVVAVAETKLPSDNY